MEAHLLLVDDDPLMRRSMTFNLERAGYRVSAAASAEAALTLAEHDAPDLILLDVGLPGMDGLDALRRFRMQGDIPVIFVTARRRELDEVLGLELGADDYVTKPFDLDVLLAHIKAVLRRSQSRPGIESQREPALTVGDISIDPTTHIATLRGRALELPPREFALLYAFVARPGQALSVDELLKIVWGEEYAGEPQVVYVHVRWLREKIESRPERPERIVTIRGVGYRFVPQGE